MIRNVIGKKGKDTETAMETLIDCSVFSGMAVSNPGRSIKGDVKATQQQLDCESFDHAIEKRGKN